MWGSTTDFIHQFSQAHHAICSVVFTFDRTIRNLQRDTWWRVCTNATYKVGGGGFEFGLIFYVRRIVVLMKLEDFCNGVVCGDITFAEVQQLAVKFDLIPSL